LFIQANLTADDQNQEQPVKWVAHGVPLSHSLGDHSCKTTCGGVRQKEITIQQPVEAFGELEMLQMLDHFFDQAIYYAAVGYERAVSEHGALTQLRLAPSEENVRRDHTG
jgi:hypothetical protein